MRKGFRNIILWALWIIIAPMGAFAQQDATADTGLISWQDAAPLQWDDFLGTPDSSTTDQAATASGIGYHCVFENGRPVISIQAYFKKENSWVKTKTEDLLAHEQLHFDITELFARKMRKALVGISITGDNAREILPRLYADTQREWLEMETRYDEESAHSTNMEAQQKWEAYVHNELSRYVAYAD